MQGKIAAVILAAGKGTRMKSDRAKVLHPICGRPLAYFPVRAALSLECAPVVVVVGHQGAAVEKELGALFAGQGATPLRFAQQKDQLGTGHAVLCAEAALRESGLGDGDSVLLLCGDTPLLTTETLQRLVRAKAEAKSVLALVTTRPASPRGYGRIVRSASGAVLRIVEEKDATEEERQIGEVNAGLYLCDAGFLFQALRAVTRSNSQGEFYLTDIVAAAAAARSGGGAVAVLAPEAEVSGVNDRAQLAWSATQLRERRNAQLMRDGVTMIDPAVTYVDEGVEVAVDALLEPQVSLRGKTRIGRGVEIGQGSVLIDVEVHEGVRILPYSHLEGAVVGKGSIVGPFARLRPGAQLAESAHVGNFVELKKTMLGKGSKANHLAYLGDAVIGDGVNVGAGTITCNYDGKKKFQTTIEDGAFIGSDTQLIAPVTIGKGAYVGTGTTVREDVPPGALAVSAGKQRNIEGWVEKKQSRKPDQ